MLGRRVSVRTQAAEDAGGAGHADDGAGPLRLHHPCGVLDAVEDAVQQDVQGGPPFLRRGGVYGADGADDAGVVEHDVQAAKGADRGVHQGGDVVLRGHVATGEGGAVPQFGGNGGADVLLNVPQGHLAALADEQPRRGGPKSAGRAGDGRHLAFKPLSHAPSWKNGCGRPSSGFTGECQSLPRSNPAEALQAQGSLEAPSCSLGGQSPHFLPDLLAVGAEHGRQGRGNPVRHGGAVGRQAPHSGKPVRRLGAGFDQRRHG